MALRISSLFALTMLAALAVGCSTAPTPATPPEPSAKPPLPRKCEATSERCEAKPDTLAKVAGGNVVFAPAVGWFYTQASGITLAQPSEEGPAIAFLGIDLDPKDSKKEAAAKEAALAELVKQLGLSPFKRKVFGKKPDETKTINTMKLALWQPEEAGQRGSKKGSLLVVAGPTGDGKGVVGVGFVPDDDRSQSDLAIMKSIESLGKPQ